MSTEVYMFFYRKDLFEQAGIDPASLTTIAQWMDALGKLKLPEGTYPASLRGGGLGILDELNAMVINSWGKAPYAKDRFVYFDENWKPRFTDEKVKEGFKNWIDLMKLSAPGVTSFDWYEATTQFAQGKAATFGPDASLFASIFIDPKQSTVTDKVGFKAMPAAGADGAQTAMWSWGLSVPEKSSKKDAAWLFVQWATSPYVTEQVSLQTLASPRQSTWADPAYQAKLPSGFGEAVGQSLAVAQPSIMYLSSADQVIQNMLDALQGAYQGTPLDEAMQKLQDQATTVVKDAGLYKQ
jgi:multiple sugar transport system substrate-binding protein